MQCILHYQEHVEIRWKVSAKWHYKLLELGGGKKNPNTLHWQMAIIPPSQGQTRGGGGGGGMSHWGLYIILVNHSLKSTLNEDEAMIPTAL